MKLKQRIPLYAPIYENGKRTVREIPALFIYGDKDTGLVFINGQHYDNIFATREEAENYWTRNGYCKPLTANEILALVQED